MYVHDTGSATVYFFQLFYKLYISVSMKLERQSHVLKQFFIATGLNFSIVSGALSTDPGASSIIAGALSTIARTHSNNAGANSIIVGALSTDA